MRATELLKRLVTLGPVPTPYIMVFLPSSLLNTINDQVVRMIINMRYVVLLTVLFQEKKNRNCTLGSMRRQPPHHPSAFGGGAPCPPNLPNPNMFFNPELLNHQHRFFQHLSFQNPFLQKPYSSTSTTAA